MQHNKKGATMKDKDRRIKMFSHRIQFHSDNKWGIPYIKKNTIRRKDIQLLAYDEISPKRSDVDRTIHFFKEDYKFSNVYDEYDKHINKLARFEALLTPDFSMFTDFPLAIQIHHTFMNRWCGAYWQQHGLTVIPTVTWSTEESYELCFSGIEKTSIVAVSTVGTGRNEKMFMKGYNEMLRVLQPDYIYCYGKPFDNMLGDVIYIKYRDYRGGE